MSTDRPHIIAIVQGRMGSRRLPGKVLKLIAGRPMLAHVVQRAAMATSIDEVIVATSDDPSDDPIEAFCDRQGYLCYRGSQYDVLDRFYQAASLSDADVVVRITADCPLIDPGVIDKTVDAFFEQGADFAANRLPPPYKRTYPIGLDVEVCSFSALERAWQAATEPHEREHVLPYLYEQSGRFKVIVVDADQDYGHLRWTVDTESDLQLVRRLFEYLGDREDFTWLDVLDIWQAHPELQQINADVQHKTMFDVDSRGDEHD
jgi:spore coat polysaccharide biosynthesis protein SpsF